MMEWILSSSALILMMMLIRWVVKGKISLRLQYALWALVLVRLLVPVSFFQSRLSVQNAAREAETVRQVQSVIQAVNEPVVFESENGAMAENTYLYLEQGGQIQTPITPADLALAVWLAGCGMTLAVIVGSNAHFRRRLRRDREPLEVALTSLPVYVSRQIPSPCLVGLLAPAIYVTPETAAQERKLRHVLEHELTHYRHCDYIIAPLRCLALALHWYNPLVWWAANASKQDGELACDEGTIGCLGEEERIEYGRTLLELTCMKTRAYDIMSTATTMTGSGKSIKERIVLIAKQPKMAAYTLVVVILVTALAVGCTFTGAVEQNEMALLSDEELIQAMTDAQDSKEIAEVLAGIGAKTQAEKGEMWLNLSNEGKGHGYCLDQARCEKLMGLFSEYQWSQTNDSQRVTQGVTYDTEVLELRFEYADEDGENVLFELRSNVEDRGLIDLYCLAYDENGTYTREIQNFLFRAEPKASGRTFHEALRSILEEQEAQESQSAEETSVSVQTTDELFQKLDETEDPAQVGSVIGQLVEGMIVETGGVYLNLVNTGQPLTSYYLTGEQEQALVAMLVRYDWYETDPPESTPGDTYPVAMNFDNNVTITVTGWDGLVTMHRLGPVVEETETGAILDAEDWYWTVQPKNEGDPTLFEGVLALYGEAVIDEGVVSSWWQGADRAVWWQGADRAVDMTEDEALVLKQTLEQYDWELIGSGGLWLHAQGESIFVEQGQESLEFFDGTDTVCYTTSSGSLYYTLTPKSEDTQSVWEVLLLLYENSTR